MPTLYLTDPALSLCIKEHQIIARDGGREVAVIPLRLLDGIVVQGPVSLGLPMLEACLKAGIGIAYLSRKGRYIGRMEPPSSSVAKLQRAQLHRAEDAAFCLNLSRLFVAGKLQNSAAVLADWPPDDAETDAQSLLTREARRASQASDMASLRGIEGAGAGATAYFRALGRILGPDWGFERRTAHPPIGPVNALLSYGYTMLYSAMLGAIHAAGLNPYLGFFHADREGHATLASDLMEEWRPVLVDRVVARLLRGGHLALTDFALTPNGTCTLQPEGRRRFLREWELKLQEPIYHPESQASISYQLALHQQVRHFARCLRHPETVSYSPFRVR